MAPGLYIGTSGWNYPHWKDFLYPDVPQKDWLACYARQFNSVEVNSTFYRLQSEKTFQKWHDATPDEFRFCIKGNRYLTHNKKLNDPVPSIRLERQHASLLGEKLAAVVWQLPANLHKDVNKLTRFCDALQDWPDTRHAIEFRHESWFIQDVADHLQHARIAVCQSDAADWPMWDAVTTDLVYIRLHGHTRTYASAYATESLKKYAQAIRQWLTEKKSVHVYFDNDAEGAAPRDAMRLREMI